MPFFCNRMARALLETPNSAAIAQNFLKIILSKMEWILSILFTPNKLSKAFSTNASGINSAAAS